jgi:hypothetical protein
MCHSLVKVSRPMCFELLSVVKLFPVWVVFRVLHFTHLFCLYSLNKLFRNEALYERFIVVKTHPCPVPPPPAHFRKWTWPCRHVNVMDEKVCCDKMSGWCDVKIIHRRALVTWGSGGSYFCSWKSADERLIGNRCMHLHCRTLFRIFFNFVVLCPKEWIKENLKS